MSQEGLALNQKVKQMLVPQSKPYFSLDVVDPTVHKEKEVAQRIAAVKTSLIKRARQQRRSTSQNGRFRQLLGHNWENSSAHASQEGDISNVQDSATILGAASLECLVKGHKLSSMTQVELAGQGVVPSIITKKQDNVITVPSAQKEKSGEKQHKDFSQNADINSFLGEGNLEARRTQTNHRKVLPIGKNALQTGASESFRVSIDEEVNLIARGFNPFIATTGQFDMGAVGF